MQCISRRKRVRYRFSTHYGQQAINCSTIGDGFDSKENRLLTTAAGEEVGP